ncbi:phage head closure protein [Paenalcaligenes sp. Me131]|uniref:phage head closure protein n=1 Tax=Paenalcaligenes sp. Me131 TaxID=3392636 RepID=UPI003D2A5ED3
MTDKDGLPAGNLNRRIVIRHKDAGQDETGQPTGKGAIVAKPWAWIKTQTGMGVTRNAGNVSASIDAYSFRIRYRKGITDAMCIECDGMVFDIKQVRHDVANKVWTDLVCRQGGMDG